MINLTIVITIMLIIPSLILLINLSASKKMHSREKMSPFECGFDPLCLSRLPVSVQFFLVGLVFLIFDVEITLLIPLIMLYKKFNMELIWSSLMFLLILFMGLMIEYSDQTIEWKI